VDANIQEIISRLKTSNNKLVSPAIGFSSDSRSNNEKQRSALSGNWTLLYTNAPDVLSISKIPGVTLEYVGQSLDCEQSVITNIVRASGWLADSIQEVYVRARPVSPNRVELDFLGTKLKFTKIFGRKSVFGFDVDNLKPIQVQFDQEKFAKTIKKSNRPIPSFEFEYLDEDLRIHRTGEGYTFIAAKIGGKSPNIKPSLINDGLGPWLTDKIGENGMKLIGLISVTPYIYFILNPLFK